MAELRRSCVSVRTADIAWYAWEPRQQRITLGEHLDCATKRWVTTLALAHRALGHVGNHADQNSEARALADRWLGAEAMAVAPLRMAA